MTWQDPPALALVAWAALYLARVAWRWGAVRSLGGCVGCKGCAAKTAGPELLQIR